jgi:hypothetical protein
VIRYTSVIGDYKQDVSGACRPWAVAPRPRTQPWQGRWRRGGRRTAKGKGYDYDYNRPAPTIQLEIRLKKWATCDWTGAWRWRHNGQRTEGGGDGATCPAIPDTSLRMPHQVSLGTDQSPYAAPSQSLAHLDDAGGLAAPVARVADKGASTARINLCMPHQVID